MALYIAKAYVVNSAGLIEQRKAEFEVSGQDGIKKKAEDAMEAKYGSRKVEGWSYVSENERRGKL